MSSQRRSSSTRVSISCVDADASSSIRCRIVSAWLLMSGAAVRFVDWYPAHHENTSVSKRRVASRSAVAPRCAVLGDLGGQAFAALVAERELLAQRAQAALVLPPPQPVRVHRLGVLERRCTNPTQSAKIAATIASTTSEPSASQIVDLPTAP